MNEMNEYLFPEIKEYLTTRTFFDDEDVVCTANGWPERQEELLWYNRICALQKRWTKCTSVAGDYCEN